jgi:uncharacterized protein YidB (DUF937 family)
MTLPNLTLAAKLGVGAVAALALVGGGTAAGLHLAGTTSSASTAPVVAASPAPPSPRGAAGTQQQAANRAVRQAVLQGEAQILGITSRQLSADLKQGTTVQQLAAQKGISQQQFQAQLVQDVQPLLDREVGAGTLTQAQEQQALKRLGKTIPNWTAAPKKAQPSTSPSPAQ